MNDLVIVVFNRDARNDVENLINSAIGEYVIGPHTYYTWDECDLKFIVRCEAENDKRVLVDYIYSWLSASDKDFVKFFNTNDRPDISFKDASVNLYVIQKMFEDW